MKEVLFSLERQAAVQSPKTSFPTLEVLPNSVLAPLTV